MDIKKKFLAVKLARYWNRLSREVLDAPSLEVVEARLAGDLSTLTGVRHGG